MRDSNGFVASNDPQFNSCMQDLQKCSKYCVNRLREIAEEINHTAYVEEMIHTEQIDCIELLISIVTNINELPIAKDNKISIRLTIPALPRTFIIDEMFNSSTFRVLDSKPRKISRDVSNILYFSNDTGTRTFSEHQIRLNSFPTTNVSSNRIKINLEFYITSN